MHFPSSRKVIFIFSVHLEMHIIIVSRCEGGAGREDGGLCGVRKGGRRGEGRGVWLREGHSHSEPREGHGC